MSIEIRTDTNVGQTVMWVANVEGEFLGISISEHGPGINMRRCAMEVRDRKEIEKLRDALTEYLESTK